MEQIYTLKTSIFTGAFDKNPHETTLVQVFNLITGNMLKNDTEKYRALEAIGQPDETIKQRMTAITPAVTCSGGHGANKITGYTGISLCDFDHVTSSDECMSRLHADAHTLMAYTTLSGNGIRVLFRYTINGKQQSHITPKAYADAFHAGNEHFAALLGTDYDDKCKNPNRLSVICHDPNAYFNPEAKPIYCNSGGVLPRRDNGDSHTPQQILSTDEAAECTKAILASEGTVYAEGGRNYYIMRTGYMFNKIGIPLADAQQWATSRFADYGVKNVEAVMRSCYTHTAEHGTWQPRPVPARRGRPCKPTTLKDKKKGAAASLATVADIENFITRYGTLRFNVISHRAEICYVGSTEYIPVNDRVINTMWRHMHLLGMNVRTTDISNVLGSDFAPDFHPFREYFRQLPPWTPGDGDDPIAALAACVHITAGPGDSDKVTRQRFGEYMGKWLTGMVASWLDDEEINHQILTLIGQQGIYKTTFLRELLPQELQRYFYSNSRGTIENKDDRITLSEYGLICLDEIDTMSDADHNRLKAFVTQQCISERMPYGRFKEDRPRIASFCATGNNDLFLNDIAGNRRWLVFSTDSIDMDAAKAISRDRVFAQAYYNFKKGSCHYFTRNEINEIEHYNRHFTVPSPEEELITSYFRPPHPGETYKLLNATNILERISACYRQRLSTKKIGTIMKKIGFEQIRTCSGRTYKVVELPPPSSNPNSCGTD